MSYLSIRSNNSQHELSRSMRSKKTFLTIMWGYMLFSVASAFFASSLNFGELAQAIGLVPTVRALSKLSSSYGQIANYFLLMYSAFPVTLFLMMVAYPTRHAFIDGVSKQQKVLSIIFFLIGILLLGWFAFLLPPDHVYVGTRMKIFMSLASGGKFGLGVIYGLILVSLAMLLCVTLLTLHDLSLRHRNSGA